MLSKLKPAYSTKQTVNVSFFPFFQYFLTFKEDVLKFQKPIACQKSLDYSDEHFVNLILQENRQRNVLQVRIFNQAL